MTIFCMIDELLIRINELKKKRIIRNLVALGFLQLTNYLLPLIIIPYIIRMIGVEKFGVVSIAQAVMMFFMVATDYGFNLTSTREISLERDHKEAVGYIYSKTLCTKIVLGLIAFMILLAGVSVFKRSNNDFPLFIAAYLMVVGQLLLPVWLFQGLEKMKYVTYLNVVAKSITLVLIFLIIKNETDYFWVLPIYGAGNIAASLIAFVIIRKRFAIRFKLVGFAEVVKELRAGFSLFVSNVSVNVYNSSSVLILGLFASDIVVGFYSAAEKVTLVIRQLLGIISQAVYPHLCTLTVNGVEAVERFWKKISIPLLAVVCALCFLVFVFSGAISTFLIGFESAEAAILIRWLAFVPFIVATNIPSFQTLIAFNLRNQYMGVLVAGSVFNIIINFALSYFFLATGTSIALLLTEVFISAGLYITFKNAAINLKKPTAYGNL